MMQDTDATTLGSQLIDTILSSPSDTKQIKELIEQGAPLWYQTDDEGLACLHAACFVQDPGLVRLLLENGAPWNLGMSFSPYF